MVKSVSCCCVHGSRLFSDLVTYIAHYYSIVRTDNVPIGMWRLNDWTIQPASVSNILLISYVTGFWKTDWNVILGLFHFISPANSYTHTLSIHSAITRLSWLDCFSTVTFTGHVKSQLRQWGPWRALNRRHGSEIDPSNSETFLRPSRHVCAYGWHFLDS